MPETYLIYSKPIGAEASEALSTEYRASVPGCLLRIRIIEEGWIHCKMDGLQCSINGPEIKYGSTFETPSRSFLLRRPFRRRSIFVIPNQMFRRGSPLLSFSTDVSVAPFLRDSPPRVL